MMPLSITLGQVRLAVTIHKDCPKLAIHVGGVFTAPILIGMPGMHKVLGSFLIAAGKYINGFQKELDPKEMAVLMLKQAFRVAGDHVGRHVGSMFNDEEKRTLRSLLVEGRHRQFALTLSWNIIPDNSEEDRAALAQKIQEAIGSLEVKHGHDEPHESHEPGGKVCGDEPLCQ